MWYMLCFVMIVLLATSCAHAPVQGRPTWLEERWGEVEQQQLDNSCGLSSLLTIMRHHFGDHRFDERGLLVAYMDIATEEALQKAMRDGLSLLEIESLAMSLGYKTVRKMLTFEDLERFVSFVPVLVYLEVHGFRHFAVVRGISKEVVWLADSSRGNVHYSRDQFLSEWKVPEALREKWSTPGGLVIMAPDRIAPSDLLVQPPEGFPPSFRELRRQMVIGR